MKQSGNTQWQRKAHAWLALLTYRLAQGSVETEPFANTLQQICRERIIANPLNANTLNSYRAQVRLGKLPKTKRLRRKFAKYVSILKQHSSYSTALNDNMSFTMGDMVNGWARFIGQDERVFASRVYPEITKLVIKRYQATGHLGVTDSQTNDQPETAFDFMCDLFNILRDETPADKMTALVQQMWATLITTGTQSIEVDNELLHDVSAMLTSEVVLRMSEALSRNPSAKDRLLHPLFGALIAMEGDKYGWESGVPTHNYTQLQSVLAQKGISKDKRILSHGLKRLRRKNLCQNMSSALEDKLTDNLDKIIKEQATKEQNKTQSIWVYSPISLDDSAETEKSVREWLFRRNNDRANRSY